MQCLRLRQRQMLTLAGQGPHASFWVTLRYSVPKVPDGQVLKVVILVLGQ